MSDKASETAKAGGIPGWIKAAIASLLSASCAAVATYASPLLDTVIKPAKPVANFQAQPNGLNVTFQNKTTGGHEGWWDFGDGSALEPFIPDQPTVAHPYTKSGNYTVKLSVKNLIHEENERAITLALGEVEALAPKIEVFEVEAVHGSYAPATFRITAKVTGADMCVWALGNKPMSFTKEAVNANHPRMVTFNEPGIYVLRLAAFNGKQPVEQFKTVEVKPAPAGMVTATLAVSYDAVFVEQKLTNAFASLSYPSNQKADKVSTTVAVPADAGFEIIKADLAAPLKDTTIKLTGLQIDPAKHDKVLVTCELPRPTRAQTPMHTVPLALTEQRTSASQTKNTDPLSVNLQVPGTTLVPMPPLPAGWVAKNRQLSLTLQQGGKQVVWNSTNLPKGTPVQLAGGIFMVTVTEQAGGLLVEVKQAVSP